MEDQIDEVITHPMKFKKFPECPEERVCQWPIIGLTQVDPNMKRVWRLTEGKVVGNKCPIVENKLALDGRKVDQYSKAKKVNKEPIRGHPVYFILARSFLHAQLIHKRCTKAQCTKAINGLANQGDIKGVRGYKC
jgi:hypothetical protein